jgi:hypothetical protein
MKHPLKLAPAVASVSTNHLFTSYDRRQIDESAGPWREQYYACLTGGKGTEKEFFFLNLSSRIAPINIVNYYYAMRTVLRVTTGLLVTEGQRMYGGIAPPNL